MYGNSAADYVQSRRQRRWSMNGRNGFQGYAAYLAGEEPEYVSDGSAETGAGVAAYDASQGSTAMRSILIGVTTGALTFILNRWLGKVFK